MALTTDAPPEPPAKAKRRRGPAYWIGLGMLLAGLAVLGWLAWQFWGTTWEAHRDQRKNVQLFERGSRLTDAEALIRIPRFGKKYVVPVYAGVSEDVLARGFGHFPHTADPGQVGNYALAGHRITHGQPLRDMPELRPGDKVIVETHRATYTYVLDTNPNDLVVSFTQTWVLDKHPHNPTPGGVEPAARYHRLITLTTCSELFHTDNRMIAFGHLVGTKKHPRHGPRPLPTTVG
ncbi:sortase domain-containing protein [Nocardioides terrisoli]|uniref:sortase domain-containing protein n=1 Tax=Nocardioides terrisoli TaxID=3388267 RepID=UPI00287B8984|nr:sortase [Nocardioides marmorisolisilvae]